MTVRNAPDEKLMENSENVEKIEVKQLVILVESAESLRVLLIGTAEGFELDVMSKGKQYKLFTQRKSPRLFKSPETAFRFLAEVGLDQVEVNQISAWYQP